MSKRSKSILIAGGVFLAFIVLGVGWLTRPAARPSLPNPNGYEALIASAQRLERTAGWENLGDPEAEEAVVKTAVEANLEQIEATRAALDLPSRVPIPTDRAGMGPHLDQTSELRMLARLMIAAGKVAENDGRPEAAAALYVDTARLGHACGRGGYLVDMLVGVAIETIAYTALLELAPTLDAATAQEVTEQLLRLEQGRETFAAVLASERYWERSAIPLTERLMLSLSGQRQKLLQPAQDAGLAAHRRGRAMLRLVLVKLALERIKQTSGDYPATLAQVSFRELPDAAIDPYTGKPFVYRPSDDSYQLYSVGRNERDDQGRGPDENAATQTTDDISAWPEER